MDSETSARLIDKVSPPLIKWRRPPGQRRARPPSPSGIKPAKKAKAYLWGRVIYDNFAGPIRIIWTDTRQKLSITLPTETRWQAGYQEKIMFFKKKDRKNPNGKAELITLNESVNFEKECIFVAIPKTGTTSIRTQLTQPGTPLIKNPHLNILQIKDSLYLYFLIKNLGTNYSFPNKAIPTDNELREKAKNTFESFFKFSAVRNPWARAVSLYFRNEGVKTKEKCSFEEFCTNHFYASDTCRHPTKHTNQLDWISDENGKLLIDYVYQLERFNDAIKDIETMTDGRLMLASQHKNNNPNSLSKKYRDLYTEKTKKIIAKRFEKDIDHFKYTF